MRRLVPADLDAAARALLAVPPTARQRLAGRLVVEADAADRYRRRFGRAHPIWGNGTLESAARSRGFAVAQCDSQAERDACRLMIVEACIARAGGGGRRTSVVRPT
jgi:hypothetical protein